MVENKQADTTSEKGPLAGFKVLDLTWWFAGPHGTRALAAWGASIYKIEWPPLPDLLRSMVPAPPNLATTTEPEGMPELGGFYNDANADKSSITLNMASERGRALFRELLTKVDAVTENFSPSIMEKWGLDYESVSAINPRIIYLSTSGYGHTGRSRYFTSMGPSAQALVGLTHSVGLPDCPPAGWGFSYIDHVPGWLGALTVMMALYHREVTGKGQYIDLSQAEAAVALQGPSLLDYTINGRPVRRPGFPPGNRATWPGYPITSSYRADPVCAPHNSYRCAGDDYNAWCVISALTEAHWEALCGVMGNPDWTRDPRFSNMAVRLEHQEELDRNIEAWTLQLDKYAVMEKLQAYGVPCGAVQSNKDRLETDPHLRARNAHQEMDHPFLGPRLFQRTPVKMTESPPTLRQRGPLLGEHTEEILGELLGYTPEQVQTLVDEGVLWPPDMPKPPWVHGRSETVASDRR